MSDTPAALAASTQNPLTLGLAAARANVLPGIVIWLFGSLIVGAYFLWPAAQPVFARIAGFRESLGLFYAMIFTAIFAGLVPYLMQALQKGGRRRWSAGYLVFLLVFWAIKGVEVDLLYRAQAWMFGEGHDPATLALKTSFDQFVYVALWGAPTLILTMLYAQGGFSLRRLRHHLRPGWYRRLILPVLIPNWVVWIPAVTLIYMLPTVLQLPVQNLVLCLWVLMVMFMTNEQDREAADSEPQRA